MFNLFKKPPIHEPIGTQRAEAVSFLAEGPFKSILAEKYLNGLDCDQLPGGKGPFGTLDNPIPVNGSMGEIKYLAKLRGNTGKAIMFHRIGSMSSSVTEDPVDCYEVVCMDGTQWTRLYFDCYHPRRSNLAPPGYRLTPFDKRKGFDSFFGFGCSGRVADFPHGLPNAIIAEEGERCGLILVKPIKKSLQKYRFRRPDF
ncbi:MAG: hypothetical protein ABIJ42_10810 [Acidobacteriota bacterium]